MSLKMKSGILYTIFGLLLAFKPVWAAPPDLTDVIKSSEEPLNPSYLTNVVSLEEPPTDSSGGNVNRAMKGRDMFVWAEGEASCDGVEHLLDRGLAEAMTIVEAGMAKLDIFLKDNGGKPLEKDMENIIIATAHMWGVAWHRLVALI